MQARASICSQHADGTTPLHWAAEWNQVGMVRLLPKEAAMQQLADNVAHGSTVRSSANCGIIVAAERPQLAWASFAFGTRIACAPTLQLCLLLNDHGPTAFHQAFAATMPGVVRGNPRFLFWRTSVPYGQHDTSV